MDSSQWRELPFARAFEDKTAQAHKVDQDQFLSSGKYPIIDQGQSFIAGYSDHPALVWKGKLPVVIFGDHTRAIKYVDFPFILGADGAKVLMPNSALWPRFAYYQLLNFNVPSAGYSRHFKFLKELSLVFPPLPEQQRIAAILERADRLRRLRRYALALSAGYLQAVFVEMFGDPVRNSKGWCRRTLRSVSQVFSEGPFGSDLKSEHYTPSGIRVIRLQNIGVGDLIDDDKAYISEAHFASLSRHRCQPGDVIIGTLGDPNLRACILPASIPVALNKADCVQMRVNAKEVNREFACWLLNLPQTLYLAAGMVHGQTRARISMGRLAELEVPIAPLALQNEFASVVHRYERLRAQQREALRQAEQLFGALLGRAFRGEL